MKTPNVANITCMKIVFLLLIFINPFYELSAQEVGFPDLLRVGEHAPDWELKNSEGELRRLSDYRGKIVLLDFWASWCSPCIKAQPFLEKIFKENDNIAVLGINVQDTKAIDLIDFKNKHGLSYELIKGSEEMEKHYRVRGLPVIYLLDHNGKILFAGLGYNEKKRTKIQEVIKLMQR